MTACVRDSLIMRERAHLVNVDCNAEPPADRGEGKEPVVVRHRSSYSASSKSLAR